MGINAPGSAIGDQGPIGEKKPAGLYQLKLTANTNDTTTKEIISGITFGGPIVKLTSGANFQVLLADYYGFWKRGFSSSVVPSNRMRVSINGAAPTIIDQDSYTGGLNDCDTISPCIVAGKSSLYTINSGDRRFSIRYDANGGTGAVFCGQSFRCTILFKLLSGSIQSVLSSALPWDTIEFKQLS